jgi:long-chain acyl-CoA synthetase
MPPHAPQRATRGGYGQTEVMGMSVLAWLGGEAAGRPNPFLQVKLFDDAGAEVPDGIVGEIAIRGLMVMNGYYNRPEENARRIRNGWHRTNDLGVRRLDGSIAFVGPRMAIIKSGVENIYPIEVENCIRQHPAVVDVCVIGVPDPEWDQNVKAVVILQAGRTLGPDEIIDHCRKHIASFKKPKIVVFVDWLPRLSDGLVDRAAVDAAHGGGGYPKVT